MRGKDSAMRSIADRIFPKAAKAKEQGKCPICEQIIYQEDFRDVISKREYRISGLCQKCQDMVFGKE